MSTQYDLWSTHATVDDVHVHWTHLFFIDQSKRCAISSMLSYSAIVLIIYQY